MSEWLAVPFGEHLPQPPRRIHLIFPAAPLPKLYSDEESILSAGNQGEKMIDDLFSVTPDSFIMIAGYKNYKGEIDRLVVCPIGVLAIEVKNYNGMVFVDGDAWTLNKYDRYGNIVERGKIMQDGGGRSPSAQINQSADILERFLCERFPRVKRVARAVLLTHERAAIGSLNNPTINVIATAKAAKWTGGIDSVMPNKDDRLDDSAIHEIVGLIKKDHEYHERKAAERRKTNSRYRSENH